MIDALNQSIMFRNRINSFFDKNFNAVRNNSKKKIDNFPSVIDNLFIRSFALSNQEKEKRTLENCLRRNVSCLTIDRPK